MGHESNLGHTSMFCLHCNHAIVYWDWLIFSLLLQFRYCNLICRGTWDGVGQVGVSIKLLAVYLGCDKYCPVLRVPQYFYDVSLEHINKRTILTWKFGNLESVIVDRIKNYAIVAVIDKGKSGSCLIGKQFSYSYVPFVAILVHESPVLHIKISDATSCVREDEEVIRKRNASNGNIFVFLWEESGGTIICRAYGV